MRIRLDYKAIATKLNELHFSSIYSFVALDDCVVVMYYDEDTDSEINDGAIDPIGTMRNFIDADVESRNHCFCVLVEWE